MRILILAVLLIGFVTKAHAFDGRPWNISTGNLSVLYIQHSPIGAVPGQPFSDGIPTPEQGRQLKSEGLIGYEDYVAWGAVELEPGKWTWDRHDEVCRSLHQGGLHYVIYPWLQFPPKWLRESKGITLMRCAEHGQETNTVSIFDPKTIDYYEAFYREVHRHFGDKVDSIYACILGPYGEGNYPLAITDWVEMGHIHQGYWCADPYGVAALRDAMRARYGSIARLNAAWGTDLKSFSEIHPPREISDGKPIVPATFATDGDRRRWLDFITWYEKALADFAGKSVHAALKYFPAEKLRTKPGGTAGGANPLPWGTYCPGFAKALQGTGIVLQPADCHGACFADKWYSTAYRHYGIRFSTEPAGGLSRELFVNRMFSDASCGASQLFTYEWDAHKDDVRTYIHLFTGQPGETNVAVYYPITLYHLGGDIGRTIQYAAALRDIADYDVLDDLTITDGALDRYRVLIIFQGDWMEPAILAKLRSWVERGGILINAGPIPMRSVVEDPEFEYHPFFPDGDEWRQAVGRGITAHRFGDFAFIEPLLRSAIYHPEELGSKRPGMPEIDTEADGVWTTTRGDQLLLLNRTDKPITKTLRWRGKTYKLGLPPHEITEVNR